MSASVLSQKLADKVLLVRAAFSQPRQGRKIVAQGASPGVESPHPVPQSGTPLSRPSGRGDGGEGGLADPRLTKL